MDAADLRLLKIKTGSLNRLKKELVLYKQEEEQERQRVARMKAEDAEYHDIKHAVSYSGHSSAMPHRLRVEQSLTIAWECIEHRWERGSNTSFHYKALCQMLGNSL